MAKKLGKFLVCTALIGSAVAGGIALYNKFKDSNDDFDDDAFDFDDFDDDFDDEDFEDLAISKEEAERGYVSIPRENETDECECNVKVAVNIPTEETDDETDAEPAKEKNAETLASEDTVPEDAVSEDIVTDDTTTNDTDAANNKVDNKSEKHTTHKNKSKK